MDVGAHGRGADQFSLRFPKGMRDSIKAEAEKNGRSMNAEIIARLQNSLMIDREMIDNEGNKKAKSPEAFLDNLSRQITNYRAVEEFSSVPIDEPSK